MELIATQYAIILHDPELRSTLARQGQSRHIAPECGSGVEIARRCRSIAFRVRLLMTRFGAAQPMVVTERPVAQ
jgi:hypothetical protein